MKQRITLLINGVEHKGVIESETTPIGIMCNVKGLVDGEGNKHEDCHWKVQNLRVGKWENAGLEITALEPFEEVEIPVGIIS